MKARTEVALVEKVSSINMQMLMVMVRRCIGGRQKCVEDQ
jgi:hypothetical protein